VQADREFRMAAATSEYHAVGWSCSGSVGCPRFFCYDLPGRRVGHNCTSMWHIKVNFIFFLHVYIPQTYTYTTEGNTAWAAYEATNNEWTQIECHENLQITKLNHFIQQQQQQSTFLRI
jgi:hypothetical protein